MSLIIRGAEVDGRLVDVQISDRRIRDINERVSQERGDDVIDAHGGVLLPGLHDHHVHLRALAASASSVFVGPSDVEDLEDLTTRLRRADRDAPDGQWIRAYGYHESVAGPLDRRVLDAIVGHRPIRIQHRSGAAWSLNSMALQTLGVEHWTDDGVERDDDGEATGVLHRLDHRLASVTRGSSLAPDFANVGRRAAAYGITGFTDADPLRSHSDLIAIEHAQSIGALPQRVHAMAPEQLVWTREDRLTIGPVKIVLDDLVLPTIETLADQIRGAHLKLRAVAIHCVTRVQLVVAHAAFVEAGSISGDRIEHASIVPQELLAELARMRLILVTQPGFIAERGDEYLREIEPYEIPDLYRCRSLRHAGVSLGFGTDAPYGPMDPWTVINAAVDRRTALGSIVGPGERLDPGSALELFLGSAARPDIPRSVRVDADADLCLLKVPLIDIAGALSADLVAVTIVAGRVVHDAS